MRSYVSRVIQVKNYYQAIHKLVNEGNPDIHDLLVQLDEHANTLKDLDKIEFNDARQLSFLYFDIKKSLDLWREEDSIILIETFNALRQSKTREMALENIDKCILVLKKYQGAMNSLIDNIRSEIQKSK